MNRLIVRSTFLVIAIASSCNLLEKPNKTGVSLETLGASATPGGDPTWYIRIGTVANYLEYSPDSLYVKVKSGSNEGWISSWGFAPNRRPAVTWVFATDVTGSGIPATDNRLPYAKLVAADSTGGDQTSVIFANSAKSDRVEGTVPSASLTYLPIDVDYIAALDSIRAMPQEQMQIAYREVTIAHAGGKLVTSIKTRTREIPEQELTGAELRYNIIANPENNEVIMATPYVKDWVANYAKDILTYSFPDEAPNPRANYFYRYFAQLPKSVMIGVRSTETLPMEDDEFLPIKAVALFRMDRTAENVRWMYSNFGGAVKDVIRQLRDDQKAPLREIVDGLMETHQHITSIPNYTQLCAKISEDLRQYDLKASPSYSAAWDRKDFYQPILKASVMERYGEYTSAGVWLHSFWVRRIAEGNEVALNEILVDLANDASLWNKNGNAQVSGVSVEGITTVECTFTEASMGDCPHIIFSCGDFADADLGQLSASAADLFGDLSMNDPKDEHYTIGNPKYVGKTFIITYRPGRGLACNEGQGGEGDIQVLLDFKLKE